MIRGIGESRLLHACAGIPLQNSQSRNMTCISALQSQNKIFSGKNSTRNMTCISALQSQNKIFSVKNRKKHV